MEDTPKPDQKTWVEEIQVQGSELVGKIQELLRDATATRVTICKPNGEELLSLPLTVGVLVGGLLTLAAPRLAAIGAIGGLIASSSSRASATPRGSSRCGRSRKKPRPTSPTSRP